MNGEGERMTRVVWGGFTEMSERMLLKQNKERQAELIEVALQQRQT
jgi:hypothetical protein